MPPSQAPPFPYILRSYLHRDPPKRKTRSHTHIHENSEPPKGVGQPYPMLGCANDLNSSMEPGRGNWLRQALSPRGVWAGFRAPDPAGQPTNFVHTSAGSSAHELDWLLLSPDTPCTACHRDLLPGLSTHKALQCDLTIPGSALRPVDPAGRQFRFQQATAEALQHAAAMIGLLLWWATAAGLPPDSAVLLCWDGLHPHTPASLACRHVRRAVGRRCTTCRR
jgi:hypothetical protein